jgi:hypothetical protein
VFLDFPLCCFLAGEMSVLESYYGNRFSCGWVPRFPFFFLSLNSSLCISYYVKSFDDSVFHEHTNPIIVVFAAFRVTEFKGLHYQILPFKFSQFLSAPCII